ncbi:YciC family protein [Brevundimonas sp. VNH65]|uniref:YciC family protein n=1 Tax=Brevundimonas sp. VNH65 TaxID=3400917 RepID=UPI003C108595
MRGEVTTFDEQGGVGVIAGDDGTSYAFDAGSVRSALPLSAGQRVDFVGTGDRATEIIALAAAAVAPRPGQGPAAAPGGAFDLGRVIQRTFASIRTNWANFLIAAVLLVGVPSLIQTYGQSELAYNESATGLALTGIGWVLWIIGTYMLQGMVVKITVSGLNGAKTPLGAAFEMGARLFLPLLGLAIVVGVGTGLGFILLVVPGIILSVIWSASTGALVVENRGIFESLQRSRDLTRGYRWPIFGLIIIYVILSMVIGLLVGGVGAATGGGFMTGSPNVAVNMAATAITNILSGIVAGAGAASLYYELRSVKEGVGPEQLASVFD